MKAGPIWDYNFALDAGGSQNREVEGWQWEDGRVGTNDWFTILGPDPDFLSRVATRWQELRQGLLSEAEVDARITALTTPLVNAAARDIEIWPVEDIGSGFLQIPEDPTWEGQVQAMRDWIMARMAWLDAQL